MKQLYIFVYESVVISDLILKTLCIEYEPY